MIFSRVRSSARKYWRNGPALLAGAFLALVGVGAYLTLVNGGGYLAIAEAYSSTPVDSDDFRSIRSNTDQVAAELIREGKSWNLKMDVKQAPKATYGAYALVSLRPAEGRCLLTFVPPDNYHRVDVLVHGQPRAAGSTRASRAYGKDRSYVAFTPVAGKTSRAIFYFGGKTVSSLQFNDLTFDCIPARLLPKDPFAQGVWADMDVLIRTKLVDDLMARQEERRLPNYENLVDHFSKAARKLQALVNAGASRAAIAKFVNADFETATPLLESSALLKGEPNRLVAVYATYLAHFSVYLSRAGGREPLKILKQGNGTCTQQIISAQYIGGLVVGGAFKGRTVATDHLNMGHTIFAGKDFFVDVTNNFVVFVPPKEWNGMDVFERLQALATRTAFGVSRDVRAETLSPQSYAVFAAEGKPGIGKQNYFDSMYLWPQSHIAIN